MSLPPEVHVVRAPPVGLLPADARHRPGGGFGSVAGAAAIARGAAHRAAQVPRAGGQRAAAPPAAGDASASATSSATRHPPLIAPEATVTSPPGRAQVLLVPPMPTPTRRRDERVLRARRSGRRGARPDDAREGRPGQDDAGGRLRVPRGGRRRDCAARPSLKPRVEELVTRGATRKEHFSAVRGVRRVIRPLRSMTATRATSSSWSGRAFGTAPRDDVPRPRRRRARGDPHRRDRARRRLRQWILALIALELGAKDARAIDTTATSSTS